MAEEKKETLDNKQETKEEGCNNQGKGKGSKKDPKKRKRYGDNAVDWYTKNKTLYDSATKIQTLHVVGDNYEFSGINSKYINKEPEDNGITLVTMNPTCGGCFDANSPLNRAVINFYNVLRGNYTNDLPFQPNDLGFYNIGFGNILAYASHIKRMLQLVSLYDTDTLTVPTAIFKALGLSISSERKAIADNEFNLESEMQRLKGLCVPKNFSYFDKCMWMFRHLYFEDAGAYRGNYIMNVPNVIFKFSSTVKVEDSDLLATGLVPVRVDEITSISEMISQLSEFIDAFVYDSTSLNISAWIKAKSGEIALAFDYGSKFATRLALVPAYSEEYKYQLLNMRLYRRYRDENIKSVNQIVSSGIIYEGNLNYETDHYPIDISLCNSDTYEISIQDWIMTENHVPTAENNMTSTRFLWTADLTEVSSDEDYGNGHYWKVSIYCDTWIPVQLRYYAYHLDNTESDGIKLDGGNVLLYWTDEDFQLDAYENGAQFKMLLFMGTRPTVTFANTRTVTATDNQESYVVIDSISPIQRLDYNYLLNKNSIIKLHKAALFSEFASDSYPTSK